MERTQTPTLCFRLTTAEILYHMPDHPSILQSFVWQQIDRAPDFPRLNRFLDFWARNLDGTLHSVNVATAPVARTRGTRHARHLRRMH